MKLVIGSAQMGMPYGLFNKKKIRSSEIVKISKLAKKSKINFIDTAIGYGDSEKIIGKSKLNKLNIITKIKIDKIKTGKLLFWLQKKLSNSLKILNANQIYAILVHDYKDLYGKKGKIYLSFLKDLKKKKIIKKIGISIYDPAELKKIWKFWKPDIVQAPFNVLDNRLENSGWMEILKKENIEIYIRSIFLQGLLINDYKKILKNYNQRKYLINFEKWCLLNKLSKIEACIQYVKQFKKIDYIIVGFDNFNQFKEILKIYKKKKIKIPKMFVTNDNNLIDPRRWKFIIK